MDRMNHLVIAFLFPVLLWARPLAAQTDGHAVQVGVQLATSSSSEFETTDVGVSGRLSWHPAAILGIEGELGLYPEDIGEDPAFSAGLVEGLFGVTVGPRFGRVRPFAKLRPGFLTFQEAPEPIPCILIFPPPLRCTLAGGDTLFALDVGGGLEFFPSSGTFLRLDAGDRAVRYPGPAIDENGTTRDDAFFSHDFRFSIGGGWRF